LIQKFKKKSEIQQYQKNTPFKEAIVFIVGGGNYVEYQNLQDYSKKQPSKRIVYGSTQILSATQFLEQVNQLGNKILFILFFNSFQELA